MFERVRSFLLYDIWRFDIKRMPWLKRLALWIVRVLSLSIRGFLNNRCSIRASSLTFFSLLSIVPIAAVVFGISQGFGLDKRLEALLFEQLSGQEAVARRILEFSKAM
ncbi:MAG: YihY/virulence factor BrkB family protein, partial [Deltaproteobacteria bacterium]|nr:YihY/virulence factor BrkB family protein [Deltaproteobacteria bacterium]